jgi:hypothetical protein
MHYTRRCIGEMKRGAAVLCVRWGRFTKGVLLFPSFSRPCVGARLLCRGRQHQKHGQKVRRSPLAPLGM